jgi:general secretion pathway protein D
MRHRWSSAFSDPIHSGTGFLTRSGSRVRIQLLHSLFSPGQQAKGRSSGRFPMARMAQPQRPIASLGSSFNQFHGSLMNRLAIPLQACRNTNATAPSLAMASLASASLSLASLAPVCLVLVCLALVCGAAPRPVFAAKGESAKKLYALGQSDEAREDYDGAYEAYRKAYAKDPNDLRFRTSYYRLRQTASSVHVTQGRKLVDQGNLDNALSEFLRATSIDPGNEAAIQEINRLRSKQTGVPVRSETSISDSGQEEIEDVGAPVQLKPVSNEPLTLHMTQDSKIIYQAIGKAAGINVLFDPDYNGKSIPIELTNVTLMDALRIVGTLSNTFWRPITENTIFVAQNSRSKHTELDEEAVQTFYLSNAWQQNDLNDVQTALRNVMAQAKVYGVPSQNAIVVRATPDELILAQKIVNDLDKARPEVIVDVAIMEVDKDKLRNIGLSWPGSISFALQPPNATTTTNTTTTGTTTPTQNLTLDNLANLNANSFAITVGSATANLLLTDSDSKILQNPRIRATDGQKAVMKVGSRIPIATGSYQTGATTAITSSLVNTQFTYIDVGVQIELTPTVHFDHDVTLKLKLEDSSESGQVTISGVTEPILATKNSEQTVRLREGEACILAGILNKQDLVSMTGIPGLAELPLLKYVFGSRSHEVIDDEIVFVLIPHIVRGPELSPLNLRRIDTGSGQTIQLRHVSESETRPAAGTPPPQSRPNGAQNQPSNQSRPALGTAPLKGQTADAAATSALAQMRQQNESDIPRIGTPTAGVASPSGPVGPVNIVLTPPATGPAVGSTFPVSVNLNGGKDVSSVPLQIRYDPSKIILIGVDDKGDLLGSDGQAIALVHRDDDPEHQDGPGLITLVASRPVGTAGVNGSGTLCTLTFQAKQAGESDIIVTRPGALDSAQRPLPASAQNAHIVVH